MATLKAMFKLFDGYSSTIDKINRKTDEATNKIMNASGATDKFNKKLENTGASANTASSGLGKLVKTFISLAAIKKGIDITDEYTNTASRLALINDGLQTQAELQDKIFAAANRSRGAYADMADAIATMGLLAKDAFKSNDELIAFTELVQKTFKIAGADTSMQQAAMRQLAQAMASGRLQGDELVSIMENAPMIYEAIAKYMGKTKAELKELSSKGAITADIIKNAMFKSADEINKKFEKMPMTFGDIWNKIKNGATRAFRSVFEEVNELINSEKINSIINGIVNGVALVAIAIGNIINVAVQLGTFIADNWSIIEPIIMGIVSAMLIYNAVSLITNAIIGVQAFMANVSAAAKMMETGATLSLTAAQYGLNAALFACPITWIIVGFMALIVVFYVAIAVINKLAGTSISATGVIAGAFAALGAFIFNLFVGTINAIIQLIWTVFVEPFIGIIEWVLNVANGGFNNFGDAVKNLIGNIISWFLSLGKVVTKIIDAIFGTDWTSGLSSLQNKVLSWGKNEKAITLSREAPTINKRIKYTTAWNAGYNFGKNVQDKLSFSNLLKKPTGFSNNLDNLKGFDFSKFGTASNPKFGTASDPITVKGTGNNGKVEVDMSDEDLKYLRDIAEREYINKFSTATLAPNIQISFGDVHETADANKVAGRIRKILQEEIAMAAEGAY
jgi:tape measure domain-containing protein